MQTTKDKFERTLIAALESEISELVLILSNGRIESHSDYKFIAGRIHGLRAALEAISEANTAIERG